MRLRVLAVAVLGLGALVAAAVAPLFLPEPSTFRDDPLPAMMAGAAAVRSGTFTGSDDFHYAHGAVSLHQAADGSWLLRFEGYGARDGPDVYLYLTRLAGDSTRERVEGEGLRLAVPGGSEDGRATVRGSFNVPLPAGVDPMQYGGITIWCERFDHFFGHAPLA